VCDLETSRIGAPYIYIYIYIYDISSLRVKLGTAWRANGQCHTLVILSLGKQVLVPAEQETGWARVSLEYFGEGKNLLPLLGFEPQTAQPMA